MTEKKELGSVPVTKELQISSDTVLYILYLLYKTNIITRNHLKHFLKIIKETTPENVAKYLVEEVAKGV